MTTLDVCAPSLALADVAAGAAELEQRGAEGLWTAETVRSIAPILSETIRGTRHSVIGAGVYVAPLHHPLALASEVMDLQELSGGRLICGLGIRSPDLLHHQTGMRIARPVAYMRDYLRALRAAMHGILAGRCAYRGDIFTVRFPPVAPIVYGAPVPPVYLAAVGPQMTKLAAREADGSILHHIHDPTDLIGAWHDLQLAELRRRRQFCIVSYRLVWHESWPIEMLDAIKTSLAFYGLAKTYRKHQERLPHSPAARLSLARSVFGGRDARAGDLVPDAVWQRIVLHGSSEQIAEQIAVEEPYCDRVCLTLPWFGAGPDVYLHGVEVLRSLVGDLVLLRDRRRDRCA